MKKLTLFTLSMIAVAATNAPVLAAEPGTATSIVRTADLDLSNASGQQTLEHRLSIAIVEACGDASNVDLEGRNAVRACRVDSRAKVTAQRDRLVELASRGKDVILAAR